MPRYSGTTVTIVYNRFPQIAAQMPDAAMEIVTETVQEMDTTVKTGMGAGGSGRTYGNHTASAPGQMPAVDTGALRASLQQEIDRGEYQGHYFTNMEYAPYQEYGTSRMLARPFMTPAAERARPNFMRKMQDLESRLR